MTQMGAMSCEQVVSALRSLILLGLMELIPESFLRQ